MAKLKISGLDDLNAAFAKISNIPFEVTGEALKEMADIAASEIKSSGETYGVRDPESDVHILDKIKPSKPKQTNDGGRCNVNFSGTRKRNGKRVRNAEIAYVNEYGKRGQPARPFIKKAIDNNTEKITTPAEKIIGDWIENEFGKS